MKDLFKEIAKRAFIFQAFSRLRSLNAQGTARIPEQAAGTSYTQIAYLRVSVLQVLNSLRILLVSSLKKSETECAA